MVELERDGPVARLFLARPEKANALDTRMLVALSSSIEELARDATVRVVVLGGRGKGFCGGADVDELRRLDAANAGRFVERIHEVCAALRRLPLPVLARLHGAVIGAGLEWGLVEEIGDDAALERLVQSLLKGERRALALQKALLQLWEEAPLERSIAESIARFAEAHEDRGLTPSS